jgi:uncharacterized protein with HEPN domain
MRDHKLYLTDILSAIDSIESFVAGLEPETFKHDDKTASAVVRKFEIIGEAAKNVPDPVKQKFPEIPWKELAGMRDKLIHSYFGVDYDLVWSAIKNRLPHLKVLVNKALFPQR